MEEPFNDEEWRKFANTDAFSSRTERHRRNLLLFSVLGLVVDALGGIQQIPFAGISLENSERFVGVGTLFWVTLYFVFNFFLAGFTEWADWRAKLRSLLYDGLGARSDIVGLGPINEWSSEQRVVSLGWRDIATLCGRDPDHDQFVAAIAQMKVSRPPDAEPVDQGWYEETTRRAFQRIARLKLRYLHAHLRESVVGSFLPIVVAFAFFIRAAPDGWSVLLLILRGPA